MNSQLKKELESKIIENILIELKKINIFKYMESMILTGSFGRSEETFIENNGQIMLKSDIEIGLLPKNLYCFFKIKKILKKFNNVFDYDLNIMLITKRRIKNANNFNFSFFKPKKHSVFTYDLYNGSYTIWGVNLIKRKQISIDPYEAKRIVANRIGELLQKDIGTESYLQWKSKLMLAIGTAYLILINCYTSKYIEQYDVIKNVSKELNSFFGNSFFDNYEKSFNYLRKDGVVFDLDESLLREYVFLIKRKIDDRNIKKNSINSFGRIIKYHFKYWKINHNPFVYNLEDKVLSELIGSYSLNLNNKFYYSKIWYSVFY